MKKFVLTLLVPCSFVGFAPDLIAQWSSDPMVNLPVAAKTSDQVQPKIRPTPGGGSYVSWFDNNPFGHPPYGYDVYLQRLSKEGYLRFHGEKGIRLADLGMSSTQDYGLDVDAEGNALLAFLDDRDPSQTGVTAVKVSKSGDPLWGRSGKHPGFGSDFKGNPKITATSDDFVVVGWINGNNLTFQRYDSDGNPQWGMNGITVTAPNGVTYSLADLRGGDNGTAIFSFVSAAGFTGPKHLLTNKLSTNGTLLWGTNHVVVFDGGSLQFGNFPPFVPDGSGGAVFGWYQVDPLQSLAQHILANGTEAFPHNGSPGSTNLADNQVNPSVSYDPVNNATYLVWDEQKPGPLTNEGISAQKFDSVGNATWGATGIVVQPFTSSAIINVASVFTNTGFLAVWSSEPNFGQDTITAAKLDSNGALVCSPFAVSSIVSSKSRLDLTLSTTGRALAVWSDGRTDGGDIYAQDINSDCSLGQ